MKKYGLYLTYANLFTWFVLPIFFLPFTYGMPVIQTNTLGARYLYYVLMTALLILTTYLFASKEGIRRARNTFVGNSRIGTLVFLAVIIYCEAQWGLNTFGVLIKIFPNHGYENKVEVIEVKTSGSRYKSQFFSFQDTKTSKFSTLEFSNIMFNFKDMPKLSTGDSVLLKGKENVFGVYVEELIVFPKKENTKPFILRVSIGNYIFVPPMLFMLGLALGIYYIIVKPSLPSLKRNQSGHT